MEDLDRRLLLGAAGLAGVAAFAGRSKGAGPLNPPAGPVASTAKPLTDVEPRTIINAANTPGDATAQFIISASGSYVLAASTTPVPGKMTIKITAADVSIDLRGFTIRGGTDGINAQTAGMRNLTVVNGVINACGGTGINAALSTSARFADLHLTDNVAGNLNAGTGAVIERVVTIGGATGISCGDRCTVLSCSVRDAVGAGIVAGQACVLTDCVSLFCGGNCIDVAGYGVLRGCDGTGSTGANGIRVAYGTSVIGCVAGANSINGIEALQRNLVLDCTAAANGQNGVHISFIGRIERCFCESNGVCGILCDAGGQITARDNACHQNGAGPNANGAGIRVTGNGNTIEHNVLAANYRGIDMTGGRNCIYTNRAWGNSNADYNMGAGNSYGPIIAALGTGDITGTANSNHPLANLRF